MLSSTIPGYFHIVWQILKALPAADKGLERFRNPDEVNAFLDSSLVTQNTSKRKQPNQASPLNTRTRKPAASRFPRGQIQ
jgi:ribonuclease HI